MQPWCSRTKQLGVTSSLTFASYIMAVSKKSNINTHEHTELQGHEVRLIHPTLGLEWRIVRSQSVTGQKQVRGVAIGQSVSQLSELLQETWRMRMRQERGVIRYHWWLIPRLLQTKSDSMLDGGWQREGNKHK